MLGELGLEIKPPPTGIQLRLHGIYLSQREGCPHHIDGKCADRAFEPCGYSLRPMVRCMVFASIINEWEKELQADGDKTKS